MLEKWIKEKLAKGDERAARFGRFAVEEFGDEPFLSVAAPVASRVNELQPERVETIKVYPEISLDAEWQRQAKKLARLFAKELKQTEKQYIEGLPKFTPQPESFKGRLGTPVIVETRISPKRQSGLARIRYSLDELDVEDWKGDPKKYKTPDSPYTVWVDEGARNMNRKVQDVRNELALDERGGTEFDGIALYIAKHNILQTRFLDLPGTSAGSDRAACLGGWHGRPQLEYRFVDNASPRFGFLVCGKQT